jgi:hypothetical protein
MELLLGKVSPIEGKKHMKELKNKFDMGFNEINHKIDMKVKKNYQVIISPLLQSMLGFNCEDTVSLPIRFPMFRPDQLFSKISSCNELTYCSDSNSWNCY